MAELCVVKRNGNVVSFDSERIKNAIRKSIHASGKDRDVTHDLLIRIVDEVVREVDSRFVEFFPNVENVQDIVEKYLVKEGLYEVAKSYILYRAERQKERDKKAKENIEKSMLGRLTVKEDNGRVVLFDWRRLRDSLMSCIGGYTEDVSIDLITKETLKNVYDGVSTDEIGKALVLSSISFIERDPAYSKVAARLFLRNLFKEVSGLSWKEEDHDAIYRKRFIDNIKFSIDQGTLDKRLGEFDLDKLSKVLKLERDDLFEYTGLQVLYDRYFIKPEGKRLELPQSFWMRVSMGLAINEQDREGKAEEFYEILSNLRYTPSTPTLFHSGLSHPQLSSCFLTTINDDLSHIFKCIGDNAQLSKWSGGLGNDWTNIRSTGSMIKSTNIESQGVIPFLKIANDTNAAINRSGRKRGANCCYLETWHLDIEDFLDLRKNTGDERRRTHDMNTSNWIPDLFMKRVLEGGNWTLLSPSDVPDLHDMYGKKFEERYVEYEDKVEKGEIKGKVLSATKLWRKMLSMLFETGHPWITFKDPCNIRSPQDHAGVIHSSNLCTEITLNTSPEETAVCNLGSINLKKHVSEAGVDEKLLGETIKAAIRMLDNVIDLNFYPTEEAKRSNMRHRPIGLGIMGFQDALFDLKIPFNSEKALKFSDNIMELISYNAILASSELAKEKGSYESYSGSKWDRGIFPVDTLEILENERGIPLDVSKSGVLDWSPVRESVRQNGMRNSNVMAIAPTATIANIVGCTPCIEPIYKNLYVKANMAGEFTIVNKYLVQDLKKEGLWNQEMLDQIKYYDGNLSMIPAIPEITRELYKEAFEIEAEWCIKLTAARAKWIDQSQSHNVFLKGTSGRRLSEVYVAAWKAGLKTTYYLRTLAATQIEKSTLDTGKYGFTQKRDQGGPGIQIPGIQETVIQGQSTESNIQATPQVEQELIQETPNLGSSHGTGPATQVKNFCSLLDPDCESCQ